METYTPWRDGNYFIIIMYARDLIESSHERLGILLFNLWETRNREILIKNWHMKSASTVKLKFLLHFLGPVMTMAALKTLLSRISFRIIG